MKAINRFNPSGGRPRKLTQKLIEEFAKLLPAVLHIETAARYLGISQSSFRMWAQRGRKELQRMQAEADRIEEAGGDPSTVKVLASEELFVEFLTTQQKALAEGEIRDATLIGVAAAECWQAAAWRLERRFPERWGSQNKEIRVLEKEIARLERLIETFIAEKTAKARC
jgi:transposase